MQQSMLYYNQGKGNKKKGSEQHDKDGNHKENRRIGKQTFPHSHG